MTCDVWRRTVARWWSLWTSGRCAAFSRHRYSHTLTPSHRQWTHRIPTISCHPDCSLASDIMELLLHILWQVRRRWGWWHCCCGCHFKSRQQVEQVTCEPDGRVTGVSTLDGGSVWVASPGGCRLGTLGDTMVTRQPKQVLQDTLADMMDLLVWCFCPPGSWKCN